jgi:hypothetical protein
MKKRKSRNPHYTELGKEYPRTWRIWYRMCARCNKNEQPAYVEVKVCDEWNILTSAEDGFINFIDDMGGSERDLEIDRINPLGDYEPGNCRWVTRSVNMNNQKQHHTEKGKYRFIAEKNGINRRCYYARVDRGWSLEDASTLPPSYEKYKDRIC